MSYHCYLLPLKKKSMPLRLTFKNYQIWRKCSNWCDTRKWLVSRKTASNNIPKEWLKVWEGNIIAINRWYNCRNSTIQNTKSSKRLNNRSQRRTTQLSHSGTHLRRFINHLLKAKRASLSIESYLFRKGTITKPKRSM